MPSGSTTTNPVLIEVTRGPLVESRHTGALAVATPSGQLLVSVGDVSRPVFPRSAIKSLQALPLIESGAADHYGLSEPEIALACASHTGTERHAGIARGMLEKLGLTEAALGCGAHMPLGAGAARALIVSGGQPTQLHNNCSGKHAGMLATALHNKEPLAEYWRSAHPVQKRIRRVLEETAEVRLGPEVEGTDGCSVPTWAMPLASLARLFARLVTGEGLPPVRRAAVSRILSACWAHPDLIAGPGRADTIVMQRFPGRAFMKTGAEGVYAGGFPELGFGFALKIDDGATRASAGAATAMVARQFPDEPDVNPRGLIKTWRGECVGTIRTAPELERAFDRLALSMRKLSA